MFAQPFDPKYAGLQKKILKSLAEARVQHQIFTAIAQAYDAALAQHTIVLSRAERKRLLKQVAQSVLGDMWNKLESKLKDKE
jgi:hypothetical protein